MQSLICPKCKIKEDLYNLLHRDEATLIMFNEGNPRVRPEDGLHIYPLLCFKCKNVTEFASDPMNESGKAIDGVEYFSSRKVTKKDKEQAADYASRMGSCLLKKIDSIKV